jgi:hypothetical protein
VIAGIACLTRITALSFLLPAIVFVAWSQRRDRWSAAAIAAAVMIAVVAPYMINCAIVFGDPFYAINYHTTFYRARANQAFDQPMTVGAYLGSQLGRDPLGVLSLFMQGVTTFPFTTKWVGLEYWMSWLSIAGLLIFVLGRTGRFLLLMLVLAVVPYAFTWHIDGGGEWRFTMLVYPIYLIAAGLAIEWVAGKVPRRKCARQESNLRPTG